MGAFLGEVARVKITPETLNKAGKSLSFKRKQELRTEAVIAYIRSRPFGTPISYAEFMQVANFKSQPGIYSFINKLVKQGIIYQESVSPRKVSYSVPESEVKVTKPATKPKLTTLTVQEITDKAMRYSWENPDDTNNLRGFIASLGKD